jgi:hypothetical protein
MMSSEAFGKLNKLLIYIAEMLAKLAGIFNNLVLSKIFP